MRLVFLILFCQVCLLASSQVPDSIQKAKSKRLSLSKFPRPEAPQKKNAYVVVTSDKKSSTSGDTWAAGRPQDDDVTFVVLKLKETGAAS